MIIVILSMEYRRIYMNSISHGIIVPIVRKDKTILPHQIEKSDVLPCVINLLSYTSHLLRRAHVLLLNIGCIGRHVTSLLSDVSKRQNDVSFN